MITLALFVALAPPPAIDKPVVDAAGVLDAYEESDLAEELKAVRAHDGPQMAVLIVASTEGVPIDDYANDAATAWGGGRKGANDGLLLVIATHDRKVRLEVGDGLQARLPDSEAARLVDMAATSFRGSRWRQGAGIIVNGIAQRFEGERMGIAPPKEDQTVQGMLLIAAVVAALVILAMFVRARLARRRGALPYAGAPRPGDEDIPFDARLPPEGAGNAFAGQLARERVAFQQDPESPAGSARERSPSSAPRGATSSSSSGSSSSSSGSSNTGGAGGGGTFGGGGASGSF